MPHDIWINLPVKDVAASKVFFTALGFEHKPGPGNSEHSTSFVIGERRVVLMLFAQAMFVGFTQSELVNTGAGNEVLFSLGAHSRAEVDQMAASAAQAGAIVFSPPTESQGWMYGCGFADLDGHRWNMLYMDMDKFSAAP